MRPIENERDRPPQLPDVCVVIPAFNLEKYLAAAVSSVLKQSYCGRASIIILDDGSTDSTLTVARQIADSAANVSVFSQANGGRVAARNRLLELASSELVAWIDGDDLAAPDWLAQQIARLTSDDRLCAVSGQGYAMTAAAWPIGPIDAHPLIDEQIRERHLAGMANAFFQSCVVTRKSALLRAGGYRTNYPAGEDYDLWLRVAEIGELANVNQTHLLYRVHAQSANSTISVQQRLQGLASCNEARAKLALPPLPEQLAFIPERKKDDWDRRIYWINIALKSGNPLTAWSLCCTAIGHHPASLLLWLLILVASIDMVLLRGNRTSRFVPGRAPKIGSVPRLSAYRLARALNRMRRAWLRR